MRIHTLPVLAIATLALAGCNAKFEASTSSGDPAPTAETASGDASDGLMVLTSPVLSDVEDDTTIKETISKDAAMVYLKFDLKAPAGTKVKATWVCVEAPGIEADYKINEKEVTIPERGRDVQFSLSRPDNGWPVGKYRVDVTFDAEPMGSFDFSIG